MPLFKSKRTVRRRPAAAAIDLTPGLKGWLGRLPGRFKQFGLAFTSPGRFRAYWLNRHGLVRVGKLAGLGIGLVILLFIAYLPSLPTPGKVNSSVTAQTTKFYDRTGKTLLYSLYGNQNRTLLEFNQMPANIRDATIAVEDKNFYKEGAFSITGYLRAAFTDIFHLGIYQGGSTITEQYVKNTLLNPTDRSFARKIKELILSIEIGQFYSKNEILRFYLNEIPYGSNAYGIEAACKTYFPQDTKDNVCAPQLTLSQSALLAAIPNAPTYYSPYGEHVSDLLVRQHLILDDMAQQHYITQAQANAAMWNQAQLTAAIPTDQNLYADVIAPQFVLYTEEQLENQLGVAAVTEGGLKVITTLNLSDQNIMEAAAQKGIVNVRASGGSNIAMVSADPKTGQVLAMIGSYDFNDPTFGNYNVALAGRQPGSSFKPVVYSTLFAHDENNPTAGSTYGAGSVLYDVNTNFGGDYDPKNDTSINYGAVSIRTALDGSLNVPAVKALYLAGIGPSLTMAKNLGITTFNQNPNQYDLSLVLGSYNVELYQMVNAYESFANGGLHYAPTTVLKVDDSHGNTLIDNTHPKATRVLDPQDAYLINSILSDTKARLFTYPGESSYELAGPAGYNAAAKTGTSNSYKDDWTYGYTPDLVTGIWTGNNNDTPMTALAIDIASPIWASYMDQVLPSYPKDQFTKPAGLQTITLDKYTGRLPNQATKGTETDIFPSWYRAPSAESTHSAQVDKVSGLLATSCTPPAAVETIYSSGIQPEIPASDPEYKYWAPPIAAYANSVGYTSGSALPTASDNAHSCSDTKPSFTPTAPTVTANGDGTYTASISITAGTFPLTNTAAGNNLQFIMDGQTFSAQVASGVAGSTTTYQAPTGVVPSGSHSFTVEVTDGGYYQATSDPTVENVTSTPSPTPTSSPSPTPGG